MGIDIDQPRLDLGDAQRLGGLHSLVHECGPLAIGGEHRIEERLIARRHLLGDSADAGMARHTDRASLGHGITEDQARRRFGLDPSEDVLLRVFCTSRAGEIVMLLHAYDKGRDPSQKRQQTEIAEARRRLTIVEQRDARSVRSGVQQAEISKIERGEVVPTLTTMNKLLHPLGRCLAIVEDREKIAA